MEAETLSCSQRARGLVHPPSPLKNAFWAGPGREHMAAYPSSESQSPTLLKWGLFGWLTSGGAPRGEVLGEGTVLECGGLGSPLVSPPHLLELHFLLCEGRIITPASWGAGRGRSWGLNKKQFTQGLVQRGTQ